jgi:hypothetical protein
VGILLSQSRWAKPLKSQAGGKAVWFWLHMLINISAVALVIAAYAIATRCVLVWVGGRGLVGLAVRKGCHKVWLYFK